jgi:hypothetical protein
MDRIVPTFRVKYDNMTYFSISPSKLYYHIAISKWERVMEGMIKVSYTVMCKNDVYIELELKALLENEKILKVIKSEFAKGLRNIDVLGKENTELLIKSHKTVFEFTASKNDFADLLELAEEDARKHKRLKKECDGVELVDIVTVD